MTNFNTSSNYRRSLLFLLLCISNATVIKAQVAQDSELYRTLAANDSLLFNEGFNNCDISQLEKLLSEDFEFFHDQSGITDSKASFVTGIKEGLCKMEYRASRRLVAGSLKVFPLYNNGMLYGAIQKGEHQFYAKYTGREEFLTSTAKFTHVWLLENDKWQFSRALSYDHQTPDESVRK